jgi:hypothetical protein
MAARLEHRPREPPIISEYSAAARSVAHAASPPDETVPAVFSAHRARAIYFAREIALRRRFDGEVDSEDARIVPLRVLFVGGSERASRDPHSPLLSRSPYPGRPLAIRRMTPAELAALPRECVDLVLLEEHLDRAGPCERSALLTSAWRVLGPCGVLVAAVLAEELAAELVSHGFAAHGDEDLMAALAHATSGATAAQALLHRGPNRYLLARRGAAIIPDRDRS